MVSGAASRFAWAFNAPAFSDVQLILRATSPHASSCGNSISFDSCYGVHRRAPGLGCERCNFSGHHTTRRGCNKESEAADRNTDATINPVYNYAVLGSSAAVQGGQGHAWRNSSTEIRIFAHSVILASCSEMMRSWLSRWSEEHPQPDHPLRELDPMPYTQPDGPRRRLAVRLEVDLDPEELAAGEAVVRFMYTQALEGVEDDEGLLACMLLADRWLLPDCVSACAARLATTPAGSLSWRVRGALLGLPAGLCAASPPVAQLQARAEASLLRTFRCPELIPEDPDHRALLLSLSPERLEQLLLARQDLQVTSENVVLALLSAWLNHNYHNHQPQRKAGGSSSSAGPDESAVDAAVAAAAVAATEEGRAPAVVPRGGPGPYSGSGDGGGGPPEVESLLRLVRYHDLTAHYRTTVAPSLPGLRELRLHHWLLAEAEATAAAAAEAAATDPAAVAEAEASANGAAEAAAAATATTAADRSSTSSTACCSSADGGQCPCGNPAAGKSILDLFCATSPEGADEQHHHQQQQDVSDASAVGSSASVSRTSSLGGREARAAVAAAASVLPQTTPLSRAGSSSNSSITEELTVACPPTAAAAASAAATPAAAAGTASAGSGVVFVHVATGGGSSAAAAHPTVRGVDSSEPAPVPSAARPRLPSRLPYSSFRRIEWTRDIRDVRLHLTGVGGPLQGGEAAAGHQLSPPVFLGGYSWHLATRFVPASAAALPAVAAVANTGAPLPPPAAAAAAAATRPSAAAGRRQLQLGIVCTVPRGSGSALLVGGHHLDDDDNDNLEQQVHVQSPDFEQRRLGLPGAYSGGGGGRGCLSVASCTVGVLDASGRTAWQLVQAPCTLAAAPPLQPPSDVHEAPGHAARHAAVAGGGGGGGGRWESWSGLSGLEPTWWESGSALTVGGVLRLYCSFTL